ncbi:MFS transporter [Cryobacterium sp. HLT2-28]|nr:MFS transporter [Cryobacterium sp. HLT2-28]
MGTTNVNRDQSLAGTTGGASGFRWALLTLSLSMLLPALSTSIVNVGLPSMAEGFSASFQQVQWIVLAYLLAISSLIVGVGRLGDIAGRRRLLLVGIAIFTTATFLSGVAPTLWLLIAARAAQGIGAASMMALSMAFVAETVPKPRIGRAMGLLGTMSAIGTALGPSLGGLLIAGFGWRAIFLVTAPLGLLTFVLARRYLPADGPTRKAGRLGFDYVGTSLLALTLGAYSLAVTLERGVFGPLSVALLLAAAVGLGLFVLAEKRVTSPLIRLKNFRDPVLSAGLGMSALVSTVMMTTLVVGPFHLSRALGIQPALIGLVMSAGPVVAALTGVPAGRLVDRLGTQRVVVFGLIGMVIGSISMSLVPISFGVAGYVISLVVITASYALFQTANNTTVMTGIRADQRGVISGMLNLSRNLGLLTGASVMGAVFAFASGATDITTALPDDVATGTRWAFALAATLVTVALGVAIGSSRSTAVRDQLNTP